MNIDTVKTRGMDKRFNMTPFIYNGCKFYLLKRLSFVACHHISVSNETSQDYNKRVDYIRNMVISIVYNKRSRKG